MSVMMNVAGWVSVGGLLAAHAFAVAWAEAPEKRGFMSTIFGVVPRKADAAPWRTAPFEALGIARTRGQGMTAPGPARVKRTVRQVAAKGDASHE